MKNRWKDTGYAKAGITAFIVIAALILFYLLLTHLGDVSAALSNFANILMPFIVGAALA
ncbi:MAG: hypothetical protein IJU16_07755 [Clostridia bacterium]|nr:hypothetical protein [Clostridia bacterium]